MTKLLQNFYLRYERRLIFNIRNDKYLNTPRFNKFLYGNDAGSASTSEEQLTHLLRKRFPNAKEIKVTDVSGGCGAMYDIYLESNEFKGLSIIKQHQSITDTLKEQIKLIHGLRINTKVV